MDVSLQKDHECVFLRGLSVRVQLNVNDVLLFPECIKHLRRHPHPWCYSVLPKPLVWLWVDAMPFGKSVIFHLVYREFLCWTKCHCFFWHTYVWNVFTKSIHNNLHLYSSYCLTWKMICTLNVTHWLVAPSDWFQLCYNLLKHMNYLWKDFTHLHPRKAIRVWISINRSLCDNCCL